jgi:hypothetical protein
MDQFYPEFKGMFFLKCGKMVIAHPAPFAKCCSSNSNLQGENCMVSFLVPALWQRTSVLQYNLSHEKDCHQCTARNQDGTRSSHHTND